MPCYTVQHKNRTQPQYFSLHPPPFLSPFPGQERGEARLALSPTILDHRNTLYRGTKQAKHGYLSHPTKLQRLYTGATNKTELSSLVHKNAQTPAGTLSTLTIRSSAPTMHGWLDRTPATKTTVRYEYYVTGSVQKHYPLCIQNWRNKRKREGGSERQTRWSSTPQWAETHTNLWRPYMSDMHTHSSLPLLY